MNPDRCNLHQQPINQICGFDQCCTILCEACFLDHYIKTNHSIAIILSQHTLSFFISFNEYIVKQIDNFLASLKASGISSIFKISGGGPSYWSSKIILGEMEKVANQVIVNYRVLTQGNTKYIAENRNNYRGLLHPQFLKDLFALLADKWVKYSQKICEELRVGLIKSNPISYLYKHLKFQFNSQILNEIEQQKKQILYQYYSPTEKIIQQYKQPSKLSDLHISKVESVIQKKLGVLLEDKQANRALNNFDSFYEILQNSQANISTLNEDTEQDTTTIIPDEIKQPLSPNFLSYEALERQIQELLIENERLKQINEELAQENIKIKEENTNLRTFKKI